MQVNVVQQTPEWHIWRQSGIGASDVAAIMGISPWRTAIDVFNDKLGLKEAYSNSHMSRGNQFEEEAIQSYEADVGVEFERGPCFQNDDLPWALASPDGIDLESGVILEIKVPSQKTYDAHVSIEDYYFCQVQWQMFVTEMLVVHFVVYSPEKKEHKVTIVWRDDEYIADMLSQVSKFWYELQEAKPPESDKPDYITIEDPQLHDLAYDYKEMSKESKRLESELRALREKIIEFGDDSNFRAYGIKATWNNPRSSYDMQAMKDDGIDIEKYKKPSSKGGFYTLTLEKDA
ncbi:MAG: YqaJ viral recombinase family protein [Pseudomonadota bacterium]|nr:YqaJ viral recombinase family protein [Pseudomonadota bacterium]